MGTRPYDNMRMHVNHDVILAPHLSSSTPQLINLSLEVRKPGKLPAGKTEIPFELPVRPKAGGQLYETYHGVFVNIQVCACRTEKRHHKASANFLQTAHAVCLYRLLPSTRCAWT